MAFRGQSFGNRLGGSPGMDMDMDGSNINNSFGGNRLTSIDIRNWQGGSKDDLIGFILRKTQVRLQNVYVSGSVLHASVKPHEARMLGKWSGVRFAGQALQINVPEEVNNSPANTSNGNSAIKVLSTFLKSRYNANLKMLDLQNLKGDNLLNQAGLFASASTSSKMFPALMKVASQENIQVESINLAMNNLVDVSGVTTLAQTFPYLKNLSLANNQISKVQAIQNYWRHKFPKLHELILTGNPIINEANYKEEVIKMFPRLVILDGQVVRDESQLDVLKLPQSVKQLFFENESVQQVATNFLTNYFDLYDRNRQQLMQLYDASSLFSLSVNSTAPRILQSNAISNVQPQNWSAYLPLSRNLQKVTTATARIKRLAIGTQAISDLFSKVPATSHNLVQNAEKFCIDVWRVNNVRVANDVGITISIHGEFKEPQNGNQTRSFDRTFIVLQDHSGMMIVASDIMTIRAYAGFDAWKEQQHHQQQQPQPSPQQLQPQPQQPSAQVTQPTQAQQLPPEFNGLESSQIMVVQKLMQDTRLNAQYARMCAEQANYDYEQSIKLFQQSQPQLPAEAFQ